MSAQEEMTAGVLPLKKAAKRKRDYTPGRSSSRIVLQPNTADEFAFATKLLLRQEKSEILLMALGLPVEEAQAAA